jgi:hypothetical protein
MSATPIPRTLGLIMFGDLNVSILDELPPGRQKIETYTVNSGKRGSMFDYISKHLDAGYQAYIVCPLVEESEMMQGVLSAEEYYKCRRGLKINYFNYDEKAFEYSAECLKAAGYRFFSYDNSIIIKNSDGEIIENIDIIDEDFSSNCIFLISFVTPSASHMEVSSSSDTLTGFFSSPSF